MVALRRRRTRLGIDLCIALVLVVLAAAFSVSSMVPGLPSLLRSAAAASDVSPPWSADNSVRGFTNTLTNDYSQVQSNGLPCYPGAPNPPCNEYGLDVGLNGGTQIKAPEAGTVSWVNDGWCPGRVVENTNRGPIVSFGHVDRVLADGTPVAVGAVIATVNNGACGGGSHVEFMYDTQQGSDNKNIWNFMPSTTVSPSNGCPHQTYSTGGGRSIDPCKALTAYMHGLIPEASGPVDGLQGDLNKDGFTDLVSINYTDVWVKLWTTTGFGPATRWWTKPTGSQPPYGTITTLLGDVNGDGRADIVAVNANNVYVMLNTGSGFQNPVLWFGQAFYGNRATLLGDINGDHKADLVAVSDSVVFVLLSNGTGFSIANWHTGPFYGNLTTLLGDVNGDGKADLVAVNTASSFVLPSTGSAFGPLANWSPAAFFGTRATLLGDVTQDGHADLVAINDTSVWVMEYSATTGTEWWNNVASTLPPYGTVATILGAYVYKGWNDIIQVNSGTINVMLGTAGPPRKFQDPISGSNPEFFFGQAATL